jgi:hypothetical protein
LAAPIAIVASSLLAPSTVNAEPIRVEHLQGTTDGFLLIRSESGAILGHGQLNQVASGDRVTMHLTFNFRDGSLDDEVAVFTQRNVFAFVSDHHIQRGPFFKTDTDMTIDAKGNVTLKTKDKDGKEKVETSQIDVPPDLANGIIGAMLLNLSSKTPDMSVGMVLPAGKGRLVRLHITPEGTRSFTPVVGEHRTANLFRIKIDLGGIAGVVAPMIGKQPSDIIVWILEDDAPVLVREVGQLSEGGPIVSIELAGTSFPRTGPAK